MIVRKGSLVYPANPVQNASPETGSICNLSINSVIRSFSRLIRSAIVFHLRDGWIGVEGLESYVKLIRSPFKGQIYSI
jgi:hypothetical protein